MAQTTTMTEPAGSAPVKGVPAMNRKPPTEGPMASTWRDDQSKWTWKHRFLNKMDRWRNYEDNDYPVVSKDAPVRYMPQWSTHRWILLHAAWPMLIQSAIKYLTGWTLPPPVVMLLYTVAFIVNAIHQVNVLKRIGRRVGFLDGEKHARDAVPDVGISKVMSIIWHTTGTRAVFTTFLAYQRNDPIRPSAWLPVELFLYSIVLDFFFYTYHRACHEVDFLWRYHKTHHLTKHPSPLLSGYADAEQEVIEIAIVPLLTYVVLKYVLGLPMGFYDWWICHSYVIFAEAVGHSGLRIFAGTPGLSHPVLSLFDADLQIEDHDLHHRHGWKKSTNYGKQTGLWDRVFGTRGDRIEVLHNNIDYNNPMCMPLY